MRSRPIPFRTQSHTTSYPSHTISYPKSYHFVSTFCLIYCFNVLCTFELCHDVKNKSRVFMKSKIDLRHDVKKFVMKSKSSLCRQKHVMTPNNRNTGLCYNRTFYTIAVDLCFDMPVVGRMGPGGRQRKLSWSLNSSNYVFKN